MTKILINAQFINFQFSIVTCSYRAREMQRGSKRERECEKVGERGGEKEGRESAGLTECTAT